MNEKEKTLDISWDSIFKIAVTLLGFYLLFLLRKILVWVVFAIIISILFSPAINFLKNKGLSRGAAVVLVYILFFGILGFVIYIVADPLIQEIQYFVAFFQEQHEDLFEKIDYVLNIFGLTTLEEFPETVQEKLGLEGASDSIFDALGGIFGGIATTLTILILSLFISLEEKGFERILTVFTPKKYDALALTLWEKTQRKVGGWFGLRMLASLFVGLLTFVALYVLNVNYAVSLAFFAGITNFIPIVGPIIAGVVIAIVVFIDAWWLQALFAVLAFIIIQQIESILTPILSRKFVGMSPILVLIALLVGWNLWGILGAILAIPVLGILFEFLRDFFKKKKEAEAVVL